MSLLTLGVGFDEQLNAIARSHKMPVKDLHDHFASIGLSEFKRNKKEISTYLDFLCQQYPHLPKP